LGGKNQFEKPQQTRLPLFKKACQYFLSTSVFAAVSQLIGQLF
jgi:hypothetical protein